MTVMTTSTLMVENGSEAKESMHKEEPSSGRVFKPCNLLKANPHSVNKNSGGTAIQSSRFDQASKEKIVEVHFQKCQLKSNVTMYIKNKKWDYHSLPTATMSLGRYVMPATIQAGRDSIDFGLRRQTLHFSCNFSFSITLLIMASVSLHAR